MTTRAGCRGGDNNDNSDYPANDGKDGTHGDDDMLDNSMTTSLAKDDEL